MRNWSSVKVVSSAVVLEEEKIEVTEGEQGVEETELTEEEMLEIDKEKDADVQMPRTAYVLEEMDNEEEEGEFNIEGEEFNIEGEEFNIEGEEFNIEGEEFNIEGEEFNIEGEEFNIEGEEFNIEGEEFNIEGEEFNIEGEEFNIEGEEEEELSAELQFFDNLDLEEETPKSEKLDVEVNVRKKDAEILTPLEFMQKYKGCRSKEELLQYFTEEKMKESVKRGEILEKKDKYVI